VRATVIASDPPGRHTGFGRVAAQIATALAGRRWDVTWLCRSTDQVPPPPAPIALVVARCRPGQPGLWDLLGAAARAALDRAEAVDLICVDSPRDQLALLHVLRRERLRQRVRFVSYLPIDFAPVPPPHLELARAADVVVPYTEFGRRALLRGVGASDRQVQIASPIPHGVDTHCFTPPTPQVRCATRRQVFGVGEDELVIGFFGRNASRKRPDLALRLVHHLHHGTYGRCERCRRVTVHELSPVDLAPVPAARCHHCGARDLTPGCAVRTARLYLHSEELTWQERRCFRGYQLGELVRRLELTGVVIREPALRPGAGLPEDELARRMGACDLHLLPSMGGGWELTVLEAAACGVPSVITDWAAPPEYAGPCSVLVPVGAHRIRRYGVEGVMDLHAGVEALLGLAASQELRATLGARGVEVARGLRQERVGDHWLRLLEELR
jgi:glycosyltransferase involved in cell wall biosynthesis